MKTLRFNHEKASQALVDALKAVSDELITEFYNDSQKYLSREAKEAIEKESAEYDSGSMVIRSAVMFRGKALLESFGKGSSMDMTSDYLMDYMGSSLWNPLRDTAVIVGRKAGEYTDFFGNTRVSSGSMAGIPIEGKVRPRKPSYSIQNAEKWLLEQDGMVERRISLALNDYFSNMKQYFEYR